MEHLARAIRAQLAVLSGDLVTLDTGCDGFVALCNPSAPKVPHYNCVYPEQGAAQPGSRDATRMAAAYREVGIEGYFLDFSQKHQQDSCLDAAFIRPFRLDRIPEASAVRAVRTDNIADWNDIMWKADPVGGREEVSRRMELLSERFDVDFFVFEVAGEPAGGASIVKTGCGSALVNGFALFPEFRRAAAVSLSAWNSIPAAGDGLDVYALTTCRIASALKRYMGERCILGRAGFVSLSVLVEGQGRSERTLA